ncbi:hypothetical protein NECAME_09920 [Necator americanus]|uniref:RSE1/DDB1/CPSF1 C-terminal domain-containing protein n=1 Tax=Necator americanus TaxID=51031 RepID=W2TDV5_NECAM|nr:hypothetical protein NECAME_09920 [Necator americanus]ETN79202.1 hypothetical protein NECAME_09920 [Necator americanus]
MRKLERHAPPQHTNCQLSQRKRALHVIFQEYDFFQNLEMHVRANFPPLCGRDHLAFRSYYHPCKNVIDGDLCEQFGLMDATAQREVTEGLDRTTSEISKKLEDIRTRYAF